MATKVLLPSISFISLAIASSLLSCTLAFSIREATVADLQRAFRSNHLTSRQLTEFYLGEIRRLNPVLHGVIEVNPDALHQADAADLERKAGSLGGRGPGYTGSPYF
ncbi:hypothetical protein MLD38_026771 [Melastoma candidum]|uniref:Uncharacterized protein n=1 Tax=Melastoma candidum TaxID=119954 RepID=A0ACB9P339_9MYRT|nr:hypothetical protein MLD38_026771 [Melastoma candidum]